LDLKLAIFKTLLLNAGGDAVEFEVNIGEHAESLHDEVDISHGVTLGSGDRVESHIAHIKVDQVSLSLLGWHIRRVEVVLLIVVAIIGPIGYLLLQSLGVVVDIKFFSGRYNLLKGAGTHYSIEEVGGDSSGLLHHFIVEALIFS
jgi:hypothetical protein